MLRGSGLHALTLSITLATAGCAANHASGTNVIANTRHTSVDSPPQVAPDPNVVRVGGARLTVHFSSPQDAEIEARLRAWVEHAAGLVSDYLGGFPVPDMDITMDLQAGGTIGFGQHFDGRRIRVSVGRNTDIPTLQHDWVMVHEMLHAAFPDLPKRHRWMQEGLSTYLETVVRVRAGLMDERAMWDRWMRRMPYGLVQRGEGGLDDTPTWGRTYWGGALFWMLVDVRLLRASGGQQSLHSLLRSMRAKGINAREQWSTAQVIAFADGATQTQVFSELYQAHALAAGDVNLRSLWRHLGVSRNRAGEIELRSDAPWASWRSALSQR